ncbi:flagellar biosynthesis protein FlgG, partial [Vibrio campbellii]
MTSVTTRTNSTINNFESGENIRTERDLDVAIDGRGFITLEGLEGEPEELYSRAGNFRLGGDGQLYVGSRKVIGPEGPI